MSVFTENASSGGSIPESNATSGWIQIADSATIITPLSQPLIEGGDIILSNDKLGPTTNNSFTLSGINDPWNSATNSLNIANSGLSVGDNVFIRIDIDIVPDVIPQKFSLIFECYDDIDGTGNKLFDFEKTIGEITSNAGITLPIRDETRFLIVPEIINGSCKLVVRGTTRYNITVSSFNFLIIRGG